MDATNAKMSVLQQLMDMMDHKMLGGLKKKGEQPSAGMTVEVETDKPDPLEQKAETAVEDMEPGMLQQLLDMYQKEESGESKQKEKDEDKDKADQPQRIIGSY